MNTITHLPYFTHDQNSLRMTELTVCQQLLVIEISLGLCFPFPMDIYL
jgi:hypothetical protein